MLPEKKEQRNKLNQSLPVLLINSLVCLIAFLSPNRYLTFIPSKPTLFLNIFLSSVYLLQTSRKCSTVSFPVASDSIMRLLSSSIEPTSRDSGSWRMNLVASVDERIRREFMNPSSEKVMSRATSIWSFCG